MTGRIPLHAFDPSGADDGDSALFDAASDTWTPGPVTVDADGVVYDNGTSGLSADDVQEAIDELAAGSSPDDQTAAEVPYDGTTSGSDSDDVQEAIDELFAIGPGGGGGFGGTYLLDYGDEPASGSPDGVVYWKRPPPVTWDFTLGSLPAGWATRATPTSQSFDGTGMSAAYDSGDGYYVDLASASPGVLETKIISSDHTSKMFGPMLTTTAGAGAQTMWYSSPDDLLVGSINTWAYGGSFNSGGGSGSYPCWTRLRWDGAQFFCSYSFDNVTWSTESAGLTVAGITGSGLVRISIGSSLGSPTSKVGYVSWTAGAGSGGLRGWWDGSDIIAF